MKYLRWHKHRKACGNPTRKPRVKKIILEHILRSIQKLVSSLPDHVGTGVKMTSKNIYLRLVSRLMFPQILGFGFSVYPWGAEESEPIETETDWGGQGPRSGLCDPLPKFQGYLT